ncbi:MAG TPA: hypothetical protein VID29_10395 [Solirubrobacteraceae bacterium]|jgi:hypothetical protein
MRADPYYENPLRENTLRVLAAAVLVALAILGYTIGHGRPAAAPAAPQAPTRTILTSSLLLTYPADWTSLGSGPAIPGLSIAGAVTIAPAGAGASAGLLTGQLPGGEQDPLAPGFLARLHGLPQTSVVGLAETQAYRYAMLNLAGFERALTLYVIPNPGAAATVLACYAAATAARYMGACEQIVASLRLQFAPASYSLTPDAGYAHEVSAALAKTEAARTALRGKLRALGAQPAAQRPARTLAHALAAAAASLSAVQPPPAASQVQMMLAQALARTAGAYTTLAAAAGGAGAGGYAAATARVYGAEAEIEAALRAFSLLGYAPAPGVSR